MKKTTKVLISIFFTITLVLILESVSPGISNKTKTYLQQLLSGSEPETKPNQLFEQVLGDFEKKEIPVRALPQETVDQTKVEVEKVISKKIEEAKEIPESKIEEIKQELRNQIYQEICGRWLKEGGEK